MDSLSSVSPSIVLPLRRHYHCHRRRQSAVSFTCEKPFNGFRVSNEFRRRNQNMRVFCKLSGEGQDEGENRRRDEELERALRMDGTIPGTSDEFVKQVSSRAYDMRRHLQQTFDSSSYDVLEANPWRETSKSVYVLTHQENQLCTMKTRRNRSEVERELGLLFSKGSKRRNQSKQSGASTKFQMLVEDVREGVLPLADAEGAKKSGMIELLKSHGGESYGHNGSHFEQRPVPPPLPKKCDWEIEPDELDFSNSTLVGKGSFGEILKASWRGTPVAVKRILPSLSDDRLVIQDFRHEVNLLVKLRHPNIVQFLGAVTDKKPLMLVTEYLRGGDLHQYLKEKGALNISTAVNFAMDIARGMAYLHSEPNVIIHRDLKPRNVLLVNSSADHLKVGDFGLSKLIRVQHSHDVYKMTGETGSYRYMAPEVFKHRKYDKKVDVFSFAMILYEMLEGDPPMSHYEPYEAARYVAEGHRPMFRAKVIPELKELTAQCWSPDMNQRPPFLEILKRLEKIKEMQPSDNHWHIFAS